MSYKTIAKSAAQNSASTGEDKVGILARTAAANTKKKEAQENKMGYTRIGQPTAAASVVPESTLRMIPGTPSYKAAKQGGMPRIPSYDEGGTVPEDQVAEVHKDEEVLPVPEAEQYRQARDTNKVQPEDMQSTQQLIPEDAERKAIDTDKKSAMGQGSNGFVKLGTALIHEKALGLNGEEVDTTPEGSAVNKLKASEGLNQGARMPQIDLTGKTGAPTATDSTQAQVGMPKISVPAPTMPTYGGPGKPVAQGELIPANQLHKDEQKYAATPEQRDIRNEDRQAKVAQLDKQIQQAEVNGDQTTVDRLTVAKAQLSQTPWKDRSGWSKFGKIMGTIGNVAGDVIAPGVMAQIPGTDLNKAVRTQGAYNRIAPDVEADYKQAETEKAQTALKNGPQPKLLSGEENIATAPDGTRYQRYELANGTTQWVKEGEAPRGASTQPTATGAGMPQIAAPAPTAGGLPAGATIGKPAGEPKAETREQHLNRYAELKNLQESGATLNPQDQTELSTLKTELTVPPASRTAYNEQINHMMDVAGVDNPHIRSAYQVPEGATSEEAKQYIADAKAFASETYQQGGEQRKTKDENRRQDTKDKNALVYVETDKGVVLTNQYDLDHHEGAMKGAKTLSIAEPVKSGDVSKDKAALRQLNDVQLNTSRYTKSLTDYDNAKLSAEQRATDTDKMQEILALQNQSGGSLLSAGTSGVSLNSIPVVGAKLNKENYKQAQDDLAALSTEARAKLNGYLRTSASVPAYQKALTGIGRSNKETLDLELNNIPMPYYDSVTSAERLKSFQENIDQASNGFPNNLPGVKHPSATRKTTEAPGGSITVDTPAGPMVFPSQDKADAFKKAAGIK